MTVQRRHFIKAGALAIAMTFVAASGLPKTVLAADSVTVFAAASLKNAFDDINAAWKTESGRQAVSSYAASSALAKQIESGAPADVFISADLAWMDYLAERKLIKDDTRANLLGNSIVLVAAPDAKPVEINSKLDMAGLLAGGKLAMGAVDSVPAGKYGKAALEKLGIWASVEKSVAGAENVRAALLLVSKGEAPYGIVYKTDAAADKGVSIAGTFPEDSHPPIVYPVAVTSESKSPTAGAYVDFLKTPAAAAIFETYGFTVLK